MLTTKEAIEKRRSIRSFKPEKISQDILLELIEAGRLAPSSINAQPWRFKIVTDQEIKNKLATAAYGQKFIAQAPAVLVCCANLKEYSDDMILGVKDLRDSKAIEAGAAKTIASRLDLLKTLPKSQLGLIASFNVAIAIEHIVLRALDYGLGTCWVRHVDADAVNQIFNWDEDMFLVALLPIGYPDEAPKSRRRKELSEIII